MVLRWTSLQENWISAGEREVSISPVAKVLAGLIPPAAVRLRRDFGAVLGLVRAHALLHQANRERDGRGRVVATIGDYQVVRDLVHHLVSDGVDATVRPETRETVAAVAKTWPGARSAACRSRRSSASSRWTAVLSVGA